MYQKNLSEAILHQCEVRGLSYAAASELCGISPRFFEDIARGKSAPSVRTLELICEGFSLTPNDLLLAVAGVTTNG